TAAARSHALDRVARTLAAEGVLSAWRDERYVVATEFGASPWFELERAAARYFGVRTFAAHVNGIVRAGGAVEMGFAGRSPGKGVWAREREKGDRSRPARQSRRGRYCRRLVSRGDRRQGSVGGSGHRGGPREDRRRNGHRARLPVAARRRAARDGLRP